MRAPNHSTSRRTHGDDHFDHGRSGLHPAGAHRDFDVFEAFFLEPVQFVVLARERLDDADGGKHFLNGGDDFAFLLAHLAGGFLDAAGVLKTTNSRPAPRRAR